MIPAVFNPVIREWFEKKYGEPTEIQKKAWDEISTGGHVLISSPTGSGKTLAAFLWSLNQLITGAWPGGTVRVLYLSPLKALNNDIQRNLLSPLTELQEAFAVKEKHCPDIRVLTRSGDTPSSERQKMLRRPPEILITTPESLNLILTSPRSSSILSGICVVIMDEIHSIADSKRGTHAISAVERLTLKAGEFQRVGLSATIRPLERIADFMGGYRQGPPESGATHSESGRSLEKQFIKRPVKILKAGTEKRYDLQVRFPQITQGGSWFPDITRGLLAEMEDSKSTLIFANSRRLTEKMTRFINEEAGERVAWSHHGSLSHEMRRFVEEKLKNGELKSIVSTSSLELGIDVGAVEKVVLLEAPFSVSSAIQRVGRAGHTVGVTSVGRLYPIHGRDFVNSAVVSRAVLEGDIEETSIPECPLDVLSQIILSMGSIDEWDMKNLYHFLLTMYPYRNLKEPTFQLVVQMLLGKYADSRIRELNPKMTEDPVTGKLRTRKGSTMQIYLSGGTIPDRGYFQLRTADSKARIGELDEEFVWERSVGDAFTLGSQAWRITAIDHNSVEVVPIQKSAAMPPFWKAEAVGRSSAFSDSIADFLEYWNKHLNDSDADIRLSENWSMDIRAAGELLEFLARQKDATQSDLPHRHHILAEHFNDPMNETDNKQVIFHTLWGGQLNAPFAYALAQGWEEQYAIKIEVFFDDDAIIINHPQDFSDQDVFGLVTPESLETLLRRALEKSGYFGARFRENASRALLLPKAGFNKRMPLWLNRMRSKKLLSSVFQYSDFPILAETWRTCLEDEFDLPALYKKLDEIQEGTIKISHAWTQAASPFSSGLIWQQTNLYMYKDDTPEDGRISELDSSVIRDLMSSPDLTPVVDRETVTEFEAKLHRTWPGYAPTDSAELLLHIRERIFMPNDEYLGLIDQVRESVTGNESIEANAADQILQAVETQLCRFSFTGSGVQLVVSVKDLSRLEELDRAYVEDTVDADFQWLAEWFRFYGPVSFTRLSEIFGITDGKLELLLEDFINDTTLIQARGIVEGEQGVFVCDTENLNRLLRIKRHRRRFVEKPYEADMIQPFLAAWQGVTGTGGEEDRFSGKNMEDIVEQLFGYPLKAGLWETEIFPARFGKYYPHWLDGLFEKYPLLWFGTENQQLSFSLEEDLELFHSGNQGLEKAEHIFSDPAGRYDFWNLKEFSGISSAELANRLWELVWSGVVTNDRFETVRRGIQTGFKAEQIVEPDRKGQLSQRTRRASGRGRTAFSGWKNTRPSTGNWYVLPEKDEADTEDLLLQEEIKRDRIRILLRRYGLLFRGLLDREAPGLRWRDLFGTLRIMELSGEVFSGYFFNGIPGIQFMSAEALRFLKDCSAEANAADTVYWLNAVDPASIAGINIDNLSYSPIRRIPQNHMVFLGKKLVLNTGRNGGSINFHVPPDHPRIYDICSVFRHLVGREIQPRRMVKVEEINGEVPAESLYHRPLIETGFTAEHTFLVLRKSYRSQPGMS